jgi:hypothetical protein
VSVGPPASCRRAASTIYVPSAGRHRIGTSIFRSIIETWQSWRALLGSPSRTSIIPIPTNARSASTAGRCRTEANAARLSGSGQSGQVKKTKARRAHRTPSPGSRVVRCDRRWHRAAARWSQGDGRRLVRATPTVWRNSGGGDRISLRVALIKVKITPERIGNLGNVVNEIPPAAQRLRSAAWFRDRACNVAG